MATMGSKQNNLLWMLALVPPLLVRLYSDGPDAALSRLMVLVAVLAVAALWSVIFSRQLRGTIGERHLRFALLFALLVPGPVGWGGVILAASFGWVMGSEIFGGRAFLPPVIIALAFAIFSFPGAGYEAQWILGQTPDKLLALWCLPGAALLAWRGEVAWRVFAGAMLGVALAFTAMSAPGLPLVEGHFYLGAFSIGILFIAADTRYAPRTEKACWLYGAMVGALVVTLRLTNPDQPDGVVFAILLGGLFAPLLDRVMSWRASHE